MSVAQVALPGLRIKIPRWFLEYYYPCEYKNLYGGRGSGKSHQMATLAVCRVANLFRDPDELKPGRSGIYYPYKKTRILSGREFNTTIETSVKTLLEAKIFEMGLNDQFLIKSEEIVHRDKLGSKILFKGLGRNIQNMRSAEAIDVWWFEEAQFLTQDLMDVIIPTARAEYYDPITGLLFKNEKWTVWNPMNRTDWVWIRFTRQRRVTDLSTHVNYYANPFLPSTSALEAEICKLDDIDKYEHDWLGRPDDGNVEAQLLPYKIIERCYDAWDARPDINANMWVSLGLDVALGGADNCAAAFRIGPILQDLKIWPGSLDLNRTAMEAVNFFDERCARMGVEGDDLIYDAGTPMEGAFDLTKTDYKVTPVGFGWAPEGKDNEWERDVTNGQYFQYRNIQMATALRQRALRTCQLLDGYTDIEPEECLFINPDIGDKEALLGVLTQPTRSRNPVNDKWRLDKDAKGTLKSPDEFDALSLAYHRDCEYGLRAHG